MRRTFKTVIAVTTAVLGVGVLAPGIATAADYGGQCGAGFATGSRRDIAGGTVYLASKGALRCAVTILNSRSPAGTSMSVWLRQRPTSDWLSDPGTFHQYAGPLTLDTWGCADYGGRIGNVQVTAYTVCW